MNVVKLEKSAHCRSRAVFRLLISMHGTPKPDLNLVDNYRTSSPIASIVHPIFEGHHQEENTQQRGSGETEKQMNDTVTQTPIKHTETDNKQSESAFHQQSLLRRAIGILLIFFFIFGVIVFFMVTNQYCLSDFVKLCCVQRYNPPV
ncbi:uncharacterized protein si:ch211-107e6.5 [Danio aesculapii]|uniref:uncharacterized protein si:ch211-107e6.5 n=1 Tax=Danio aesculapii TaxID=1142201 RepID=UPI0024BF6A86|nr:uncharacterized protein si:ch211-107e6.5 [Danio aesculapii]